VSAPPTRVAVCIASYRRPEGLAALLQSLDAQVFAGEPPAVRVVVADNDAGESARAVCESAADWLRHPLTYVVEKRRGIAPARNASLAPVLGEVDWIAFADDDEIADPGWLDALLRAQRATGADVVTGPVATRFAGHPPAWIVDGGLLAYPDHPDGAALDTAWSGNALVRATLLDGLDSLFDEGLERGSDTEFFVRLTCRGHTIVWAASARVTETVLPERARLGWILRRAYLEGIARVRLERRYGLLRPSGIALRGVGRLLQGLVGAAWPGGSRATRARSLRLAALGLGRCVGLAREARRRAGPAR
jgi:glycosyltransferase involved in cell wall biosynthesis